MKILALETSAKSVSAAVTDGGVVRAYTYQNTGLTHSRTLMPLVDAMLRESEQSLADMDLLAVAAGRLRVLELLLWPYVTAIKSVPVASFIIICLIWMSTRQLAVFISFLMVFPVIYSNTLQGIKSADGALLEMARVYRVPFSRRLGYIYAPQVKPFLLSGCSVALGMSWLF